MPRNATSSDRSRRADPSRRAIPLALLLVTLVGALTACGGESEQAKAEKSVCEAKTAISTSVQSLQHLTPETVTVATVQGDVSAIAENLKKMKQAEEKLSGPRKEEIAKANEAFSSELSALTGELATLTPANIKAKLTAAVEKLAASYKQALAPISC